MVKLYDKSKGELIGQISEDQLQFLTNQMEEESLEDRDYSITPLTLEYFSTQGIDPALLDTLRRALGERPEMVIEWEM